MARCHHSRRNPRFPFFKFSTFVSSTVLSYINPQHIGNAFVILFGVVLPKIVMGLQNLHHSFPPKTWQVAGNASDPDDQANPSPTPPPIRPNQQHIYAIPSEYDRRSSDSDYDNRNTVM